jgi:hypothetical protein
MMLLSGVIAFVLFFFATAENKGTRTVLVANRDIAQGQPFNSSDFSRANVHVQGTLGSELLTANTNKDIDPLSGMRATRAISRGSFLLQSDYAQLSDDSSQGWFSISIDPADALGGDIKVNDQVDIFNGCGVEVGYKIKVVSVKNDGGGGGLGSSGSGKMMIKLAADDEQLGPAIQQALNGRFKLVLNNERPDLRPASITPCNGS